MAKTYLVTEIPSEHLQEIARSLRISLAALSRSHQIEFSFNKKSSGVFRFAPYADVHYTPRRFILKLWDVIRQYHDEKDIGTPVYISSTWKDGTSVLYIDPTTAYRKQYTLHKPHTKTGTLMSVLPIEPIRQAAQEHNLTLDEFYLQFDVEFLYDNAGCGFFRFVPSKRPRSK